MTAIITPIEACGTSGYLFVSSLGEGICFVPEACVSLGSDNQLSLDQAQYLVSGWARRNGLLNPIVPADRLFPDIRLMLSVYESADVIDFLGRLRHPKFRPVTRA